MSPSSACSGGRLRGLREGNDGRSVEAGEDSRHEALSGRDRELVGQRSKSDLCAMLIRLHTLYFWMYSCRGSNPSLRSGLRVDLPVCNQLTSLYVTASNDF